MFETTENVGYAQRAVLQTTLPILSVVPLPRGPLDPHPTAQGAGFLLPDELASRSAKLEG